MGLDISKTTVNTLEGVDVSSIYDFDGLLGSDAEQRSHFELMHRIEQELDNDPPCMSFPDAFFAETDSVGDIQVAKRLCSYCPVMMQCAEHAMRFNISDGVWGGLSAGERKVIRTKHIRKYQRTKKKERAVVK